MPVLVLVVVMLLDYATGMTKAWNAGELSSRVGLRGILKKVGYPLYTIAVDNSGNLSAKAFTQ